MTISGGLRHFLNPLFERPGAGPMAPDTEGARIRAAVRADPDYRPTPLCWRPNAARRMGLGAVALKYEGARLVGAGLASFKAIGVMAAMAQGAVAAGTHTLVCASDGNYGRALAWAARRAGLHARIFLPERVSAARFASIAAFGAEAVPVAGGYDCAMHAAALAAEAAGVMEMSDTGYPGAETVPRVVGAGYGVIAEECLAAWPERTATPTHVFVPVGVGGFAAGLAEALERMLGPRMPALVTVEPIGAESLLESLSAARLISLQSDPPAAMQCLACETPSTTAWPILRRRTAHALAIGGAHAFAAMRAMADGGGDPPVVAGDSGAASFAALQAVCADPGLRERLGLDTASRVLVMVSEGATDPQAYARIVGSEPREVAAHAAADVA